MPCLAGSHASPLVTDRSITTVPTRLAATSLILMLQSRWITSASEAAAEFNVPFMTVCSLSSFLSLGRPEPPGPSSVALARDSSHARQRRQAVELLLVPRTDRRDAFGFKRSLPALLCGISAP